MKIRADFVTNSSSSSFVSIRITNEKLVTELMKIGTRGHFINNDETSYVVFNKENMSVNCDDIEVGYFPYYDEVPDTAEKIICFILDNIIIDGNRLTEENKSDILEHVDEFIKDTEEFSCYGGNRDTEGESNFNFDISFDGKEVIKKYFDIDLDDDEEYEDDEDDEEDYYHD